jgi:hypothetical protein
VPPHPSTSEYRFTATDALCNRLENWYLIGLLLDRGQIDFEGCS